MISSLSIIDIVLTGAFLFSDVPSRAALPIIRPELGRQHSMSDRARVAMQGYLNHFLGNLDIVNSREVHRGDIAFINTSSKNISCFWDINFLYTW